MDFSTKHKLNNVKDICERSEEGSKSLVVRLNGNTALQQSTEMHNVSSTHTHLHHTHQWRWNQYLQLASAILNSCCHPRVHLQCNLLPLCAGEWPGFLSLCCCRWWLCVCRLKRTMVSEQFLICRPRHTFLWDQTLLEEKLCRVLLENTSCTQLSPNYTAKHIQCDSFYGLRGNQA